MRYDTYIELIPPVDAQSPQRGTMQYGFKRHIGIAGFQKLVNQWLKALLTLQGSDASDRKYGTVLPNLIGSNVSSHEDLQSTVEMCVDKASEDVLRYQALNRTTEETEMLASATITSLLLNPHNNQLTVRVLITNQAGTPMRIQVPLSLR